MINNTFQILGFTYGGVKIYVNGGSCLGKKVSLLLFLLFLFVSAGCNYTQPKSYEVEEYLVYSSIIEHNFKNKLIVINAFTMYEESPGNPGNLSDFKGYIHTFPGLSEQTIQSFIKRNNSSFALNNKLLKVKNKKIILQKREVIIRIFKEQNGWDKYYRIFPGSQGFMTLSKVGFNSDISEAIVYMGNSSAFLGGGGSVIYLIKKDGRWIIKREMSSWAS